MIYVKRFEHNPFSENTYVLYEDTGSNCIIVDPGMCTTQEETIFLRFIQEKKLKPSLLLNTHCHVDHVLGNKWVYETYGLLPQFHEKEAAVLSDVQVRAPMYGLRYEQSPIPTVFLPDHGELLFDCYSIKLLFAPGHSPGHLCFYFAEEKILLGGDVLFRGSIGRTDLPGGNHQLLLKNIKEKLYTLPDETVVYPGHGPETTIGTEKLNNPFIRG